jgi:hypothetical protein
MKAVTWNEPGAHALHALGAIHTQGKLALRVVAPETLQ